MDVWMNAMSGIDRAQLKKKAKEQMAGKWPSLLLLLFVIFAIGFVMCLIPIVGSIAFFVLSGAFTITVTSGVLKIVDKGEKVNIGTELSGITKNNTVARGFWGYLRYNAFTMLWGLLLIIPGIIKAISYSQMWFLLADHKDMTAAEAQKRSMEMMEGHKGQFFVLSLSFFGWMLLACCTFGILLIWLFPYMQTTFANFYRRLEPAKAEAVKPEATTPEAGKTTA